MKAVTKTPQPPTVTVWVTYLPGVKVRVVKPARSAKPEKKVQR